MLDLIMRIKSRENIRIDRSVKAALARFLRITH